MMSGLERQTEIAVRTRQRQVRWKTEWQWYRNTHTAYSNLLLSLTSAVMDIPYIVTALVVRRSAYFTSHFNVWI